MSLGRLISSATLPFTARRITYSPDGNWIGVCGPATADPLGVGGVAVINAATGRPRWRKDSPGPMALAFTTDGHHLVLGSDFAVGSAADGTVRHVVTLLTAESGTEVWQRADHSAWEITVSPDSQLIAIVRGEGAPAELVLLNTATGDPLHRLGQTSHLRFRPVFSADGQRLLIYADDTLRLISCASGETQAAVELPFIVQATLLENSGEMVAVQRDARVVRRNIDATKGAAQVTVLEGPARQVIPVDHGGLFPGFPSAWAPVSFSPDNTRIAALVASRNILGPLGNLRLGVFRIDDGRSVGTQRQLSAMSRHIRVAYSADGRLIAANGSNASLPDDPGIVGGPPGTVGFTLLDPASGVGSQEESDEITDLAFSPDGCQLAIGGADFVRVRDLQTLRSTARLAARVTRLALKASPGGSGVVVAIGDPATGQSSGGSSASPSPENIALFHAETGARLWTQHLHPGDLRFLGLDATGETLVVASSNGAVRLLRTLTGQQRELISHGDAVRDIAISPRTGSWLATASQDKTARRINLPEGSELWQTRHPRSVSQVAISSNEQLVATACADNAVRVLSATDGGELRRIERQAQVGALAFAPGGATLGIGYTDSSVSLIDADTGAAALPAVTQSAPVTSLAFSPDGALLAVAAGSKVRIYALEPPIATLIIEISRQEPVTLLAFHPVDALLTVVSEGPNLISYDPHTGHEQRRVIHPGGVRDAAYSPDGTLFATGGSEGTIRIYPGRVQ